MRRGGLVLLFGLVIAAAAALLFFFFFQPPPAPETTESPPEPTPVPRKRVVAARIDIPKDTILTEEEEETFLRMRDIPEPDYNANPNQYFTRFEELRNKVTLRDINAEDVIRADDVADAGLSFQVPQPDAPNLPRNKVFPLEVGNLTGVADQIRTGDSVDLIMTYEIRRLIIRPTLTLDAVTGRLIVTPVEETLIDRVTKTMVQNVEVVRVLKPAVPQESGTPTPEGAAAPPPSGAQQQQQADTYVPGAQWILLLAMTDQEAEIVKFTLDQQDPKPQITLVLRGRNDSVIEETTGVTMRLLTSRYGLPLPEPLLPLALAPEEITPGPARPSPTPPPIATPLPIVTPTLPPTATPLPVVTPTPSPSP